MKKNKQKEIEKLKAKIKFHEEMGNNGLAETLKFRLVKLKANG